MNKKILSISLCALLAVGTVAGCGKDEAKDTVQEVQGVNVTVENAAIRNIETQAPYTGELITSDTTMVTSKVSAKILTINAEVGDWVNKGDVLMVLDSSDYAYQLKQAEASYAQAQAAYNSAKTGLDNVGGVNDQTKLQLEQAVTSTELAYNTAKTNFDRQTELYNMGAISLVAYETAQTQLDNARIAYESAQKNYEIVTGVITPGNTQSAENGVKTAEAAMNAASLAADQARVNIAATRITAPISGYVSAKNVALGQFAAAGSPLFTISNPENLEAEIRVTEAVIGFVEVGGKAIVDVSSASLKAVEGTISVVNPVKDAMTGMYTVRVSVPNTDKKLNVGMIADVKLVTTQSATDAVAISAEAIMQDDSGYYVYVVSGNSAEKRNITIGVTDGVYTQVTDGVAEGEKVVVQGKEYLSDKNNQVNIIE